MADDERGGGVDPLSWRRQRRQAGPTLPLFDVYLDAREHPRSGRVFDRLVLSAVDWVNVVAFDQAGLCVMIRQFRFGSGYITLETPGGMVDSGEDSRVAAERELLEETGYGGGQWRYLGAVEPNPALHDNLCHHWLATDVDCLAEPQPGQGEAIEVVLLPRDAIVAAARRGVVRHALALSALGRALPLWPAAIDTAAGVEEDRWLPWGDVEWSRVAPE